MSRADGTRTRASNFRHVPNNQNTQPFSASKTRAFQPQGVGHLNCSHLVDMQGGLQVQTPKELELRKHGTDGTVLMFILQSA